MRIDRFTGGTFPGALFNEQPVFGDDDSEVGIDLLLRDPDDEEIGLILLLIKDLWTSDLPIGGEIGVGRGRLKGKRASLTLHNANLTREWRITATAGEDRLEVTREDQPAFDELEQYVSAHLQSWFTPRPEAEPE